MAEETARDRILAIRSVPTAAVAVPEWGGERLTVSGMTVRERAEFDAATAKRHEQKRPLAVRERLVIACVKGPDGRPLFAKGDEDALGELPVAGVNRLYLAAATLCGYGAEDAPEDDGEGN